MKKVLLYLTLAVCLIGCANELTSETEETATGKPVTFKINVLQTKATKDAWAAGDVIYVFFKGLESKYLVLLYNGSNWSNTAGNGNFDDTDFSPLVDHTLTAVHLPVAVDVTYTDGSFFFTNGGEPVYNYYLSQKNVAYTIDGTTVSASLALEKPIGVAQFHIAGIQTNVGDYTFGCSKVKPVACASVGTDGAINERVLQAGARLNGVADADGGIFAGQLVSQGSAIDYVFTVASDDNIYTLTRTNRALLDGRMYNFPALSEIGGNNWTVTSASDLYVDLGLPSGTKWAKYNIGATIETAYGDYFAWGETATKSTYNWSSYFDATGEWGPFIKYALDKSKVLDKADDVAYVTLGGKFRMPTIAEWTELRDNCNWAWKTSDEGYPGGGFLVTSKQSGNTNTLFLPAAGGYNADGHYQERYHGYYWSSSLGESYSYEAQSVDLDGSVTTWRDVRIYGFSVRPVYK